MKILLTSISKKVPLINCVKEAALRINKNIKLIGGDQNPNVIGKYFCDDFLKMDSLNTYTTVTFLDLCLKYGITHIIPTRDAELLFFSNISPILKNKGIHVMVSKTRTVNLCLDKYLFYQECYRHSLPVIKTAESLDELESDFFIIKERYGSGSKSISGPLKRDKAKEKSVEFSHPIFQPFIDAKEYSIDIYIDRNGSLLGSVPRSRDLVVDGESQITTTVNDRDLQLLAHKFAKVFPIYGHAIFQVFKDSNELLHLIECNSRFGGASSLSIKAGLDSFYWFLLETTGKDISYKSILLCDKKIQLIRYPKDEFIYDPSI